MKIYFLVSGLLRSFTSSLLPFIEQVNKYLPCELYICTTNDENDTKFTSSKYSDQIQQLLKHPLCKVCIIHKTALDFKDKPLTQREKNTIYQWYHIQTCFNLIKHVADDDILVRIRPDISFTCSVDAFVKQLHQPFEGLFIPSGNDIFHASYKAHVDQSINDQLAIGRYAPMKQYCELYSHIDFIAEKSPLVSEAILWRYLTSNTIPIQRINLPYTLCLSECKLVAITGDSGAGKTTLVNALRKVFPYDSNLVLETDRYHKWERHHTGWKNMTHLNPEANLLEKMQDDTYRLKLGEQIQHVDYDHATGKFTEPQVIDSKNYVFLCGLHTLFKEEMRSNVNLKVYVDTEKSLKRFWKIQRDMKKRGYTFQQCDEIFRKREADFEEFILPQKQHADILIQYYTDQQLPAEFSPDFPAPPVNLRLETSPHITAYIQTFLEQFCDEILLNPKSGNTVWFVKDYIAKDQLLQQTPKLYRDYLNPTHLEDSYLGLLQTLLVMILIDPSQSKQTTVKAS